MPQVYEYLTSKRKEILVSIVWMLAWIIPWGKIPSIQRNLVFVILMDMSRLGAALLVFIVPGALLYLILRQADRSSVKLLDLIPIGFTFSTLVVGIIGLAGRLLGFSFELVKFVFAFTGFVELIALMKLYPKLFHRNTVLCRSWRESINNPPLLAALFIGILFLVNVALFFIDDWTYLAYLTNWQYSTHLNFTEIIFGTTSTAPARFWLALYPMGQALLSDLGGVPGILLLGHYLEIYLVIIANLAMYYFARTLGLSRRSAGFSVLIHVALLGWIVGSHAPVGLWFIRHMAEDKVSATFILAPVLFGLLFNYISRPHKQNYLLVLLAGIGLTITHPVTLFYVVCIAFGVVSVSWLMRKITWLNGIKIIAAILIWTIPYGVVRFSNHPSVATMAYDAEHAKDSLTVDILLNIRSDGLYGMHPYGLMFMDLSDANVSPDRSIGYQLFRAVPFFIIILAGLIVLPKIKEGNFYLYVLMSVAMVLLALIPYTGTLLGYIVSARMLFRAAWFAPLGLGVVAIFKVGWDFVSTSISRLSKNDTHRCLEKSIAGLYSRLPMLGFTLFVVVGLVSPATWFVLNRAPDLIPLWSANKQLADVGDYISKNNSKKVTVITLNDTDNYLPGISAKAIPVSFREEGRFEIKYFLTDQELEDRKDESDIVQSLDPLIPVSDRIQVIKKYQVKYILADMWQANQFMSIMNRNDRLIGPVFKTNDFVLFEVNTGAVGE